MSRFDDDVVSDLQCRFSEGETPTWEEFYEWIEDIQDGFDAHNHSGFGSGDGAYIPMSALTGYAEYEDVRDYVGTSAIVNAVEVSAGVISNLVAAMTAVEARLDAIELDYLVAADLNPYALTSAMNSAIAAAVGAVQADVDDNTSAIDVIWLDYLKAIDLLPYSTALEVTAEIGFAVAAVQADVDDNTSAIDVIWGDYLVAADLSGHADALSFVHGVGSAIIADSTDIGQLDSRLDTIEGDYLVALDLSGHAVLDTGVHGVSAGYIASTDDLDDLDDRVEDIEVDYTTANEADTIADAVANDYIDEHTSVCGNWDG